MTKLQTTLTLFKDKRIRRQWDETSEKWWFSVTDVVSALTDSNNPQV